MQIPIFRGGGCVKKVKLGEICEIQAGGTPSRNKKEFWAQGNIPWVKIKDINSKYISKVEEHITELGLQFSSAKLFSRGTILYTIFATIGEVAILDIDAATNQAIAGLHLKSEKVLKEYLYFFLLSIKNRVKNDSRGVAQNNINLTYLKNIEVPIVENSIQQEICNNLTKINQIITLRNQQLIELSNLVKSRFNEMFGDLFLNEFKWDYAAFNEFAKFDTKMISDFTNFIDLPHIGIDSIEKNTGKLIGYRTVGEDQLSSGKYLFTKKHIIYSKIRPNLNKVALPDFMGVCSADAYPILTVEEKMNRIFLAHVLRSDYFLNFILSFSSRTNLPKVNKSQISKFKCPLPPLSLQNEFADFVAQVDKSQLAIQKSLEELETLKKSLMQEYFG